MVKNGTLEKKREREREREREKEWENELIFIYGEKEQYETFYSPSYSTPSKPLMTFEEGEFGDIMQGI